MSFSFQMYSSRNVASQTEFLSTLAALGYTSVEGYRGLYDNLDEFSTALSANGLTMPSGHFGLEEMRADFDGAMALADTLGVQHVIVPFIAPDDRPTDKAGWQSLGRELEDLGAKVRAAGKTFSWHNHDFEFVAQADGSIPMETILEAAPSIGWEADLAWVARAGLDPAPYVTKYADRIVGVHVKDIAAEGTCEDEDGWADVGEGVLAWKDLFAQIRSAAPNAILVAEHDNPSDAERFARVSISNMKDL